MGSTKHEKSFVDFEKPYEQNVIGLKGIFYFGIGLFLLIVITFALMWALLNVLEDDAKTDKGQSEPMALSERERLPPEPRLQLAPGFGVESPNGRVNMELRAPQAEYWELKKQWAETIGSTDRRIRTPERYRHCRSTRRRRSSLNSRTKARSGAEAEQNALRSKMLFTDSSSGRRATERRR